MKKITILLSLTLAIAVSVGATPVNADKNRVLANFSQQFKGAENVSWAEVNGTFEKASFYWAGHQTTAYFNKLGDFVGAIRTLYNSQLPLAISRSLAKSYKGHEVKTVRELTNAEGTSYSVVVTWKNKSHRIHLLSDGSILASDKL